MGISALKDAIYQAVKDSFPEVHFYPEQLDTESAKWPNLFFVEVTTTNLQARIDNEQYQVANTTGTGPPILVYNTLARMHSHLRLQLRDNLGQGLRAEEAFAKIRALRDRMEIWAATPMRIISVAGAPGVTTKADVILGTYRGGYDRASGVYLQEYDLDVPEWRLLDPNPIGAWPVHEIDLTVGITKDIVFPPVPGGPNPRISATVNRTVQ